VHPRQDLDQRRLAGAVLPDQRVRLTRVELEVDLAQGGDRVERRGHVGEGVQRAGVLVHGELRSVNRFTRRDDRTIGIRSRPVKSYDPIPATASPAG
jgi:hypothetical protein